MNLSGAQSASLIRQQRRRRQRSAFASLVSTPTAAAITMPQGARLVIRNDSLLGSAAVALTIGSRTISVPAGPKDSLTVLDWLPAGSTVTISSGFTLMLDNGLGVYLPIGAKA